MSTLTDALKQDHVALVESLGKVKALGISTLEGRHTLLSVKSALLAHLAREDEQLYPVLREAAGNDRALMTKLEVFARDMELVTSEAVRFFEKYADGGSGIAFASDYGHLHAVLAARIRKEETNLYPEYERIRVSYQDSR